MNPDRDDLLADERVLDVLLEERLGAHPPPDLQAAVLAVRAHGAAGAAAQRLRAANLPASAPPRRWLAAAAVLLGVLAVSSALLWRNDEAAVPIGAPPAPQPVQDPQPRTVVPVDSLEALRALLPQVTAIEVEIERLDWLPFPVDVRGAAVQFAAPTQVALALTEVRRVDPAGWDWSNRVDLLLPGGRRIAMAIDTATVGLQLPILAWPDHPQRPPQMAPADLRLGLRGLHGDLALRGEGAGADWLRAIVTAATKAAKVRHGIATSVADLDGPTALPAATETLRLFEVTGDDLKQLANFPALRRLDLSGLQRTLSAEELTTIGHLTSLRASLQELRLDGCRICDLSIVSILPLVHLQRLELRGVATGSPRGEGAAVEPFTGEGCQYFSNSSLLRDGPWAIDLGTCPNLTDAGLAAIAQWSPRELHLDGAGAHITAAGWQALLRSRHLTHLDLSRWALDAQRLRDLAARTDLEVLVLHGCNLDDSAVARLHDAASTLRKLDLTGNPAITAAALAALRTALPTVTVVR